MPTEKITYSVSVQPSDGPRLISSDSFDFDAYGKFSAVVPGKAGSEPGTMDVHLPWGSGGLAGILVVVPSKMGDDLSYKVNDATASDTYVLDGPHVLLGKGAVGMLAAAPSTLFFSNDGTEEICVDILIGGDATP